MSIFQDYVDNFTLIDDDLDTIQSATGDVADALDAVEAFLGIPAQISSALNSANSALSLPSTVINVLKTLPFGIGTAVKLFDTTTDNLKASISTARTTINTIDDKLDPVRDVVEDGQDAVSVAVTNIAIADTAFIVVADEAKRLQDSLGNQEFYPGGGAFRLPSQLAAFNLAVAEYAAVRDSVLGRISEVAALAETAANALASAMPSVSVASGLKSALEGVFDPITDLLNDVEDALSGVSAFGVSALDVLDAIGDFAGFIVDAIVGLVNSALSVFGLNLNSIDDAINDLLSDLLSPFNPIQQAINDLNAEFNELLADLTEPLTSAVGDLLDLVKELQDAVDVGILFDNSVVGDEAPDLVLFADTLSGTEGVSDAIYGLRGNDILTGGTDDFVFGGNGRDTINAEGARVEAYGGRGRDRITVTDEDGSFVADGGEGSDIMIGGDNFDVFFGNAGNDLMFGGGSQDVFYFSGELGDDRVFGGDDILGDAHFIDTSLTGGQSLSVEEFIEDYAVVTGNRTVVTFDNDSSVTFFGVNDAEALYNTIIWDGPYGDTALA